MAKFHKRSFRKGVKHGMRKMHRKLQKSYTVARGGIRL